MHYQRILQVSKVNNMAISCYSQHVRGSTLLDDSLAIWQTLSRGLPFLCNNPECFCQHSLVSTPAASLDQPHLSQWGCCAFSLWTKLGLKQPYRWQLVHTVHVFVCLLEKRKLPFLSRAWKKSIQILGQVKPCNDHLTFSAVFPAIFWSTLLWGFLATLAVWLVGLNNYFHPDWNISTILGGFLDGSFARIFVISRGWLLMTLVIPWNLV